nr:immunoglobulin heavy chain junction region [Mus musculus]MBK4197036.1 immunoglobulin heavy chain junction region [Mus musculus]MBK4197037.1 immunoglobulin heavy chain junction region [Mus musculus]MBK4197038.1 immunoglobulin heavy chain junction region [Mus musculus]MBK4197039.1 immunoglobulin heavy chain junction region [Mus musculus]
CARRYYGSSSYFDYW